MAMPEKPKKKTPSQCRYDVCKWNSVAPEEDSQECVACDGLKHPRTFLKQRHQDAGKK
jgi:hypothetical protein